MRTIQKKQAIINPLSVLVAKGTLWSHFQGLSSMFQGFGYVVVSQFNIFWHLGDVNCEFECSLSKSVNHTKLCVAAGVLVGRDVTQRDFKKKACRREMDPIKLHKSKCKVLHMGQSNPKHKYRLCRQSIDSSSENDTQSCWLTKNPARPASVCFQPRKTTISWSAIKSMISMSRWLVLPLCSALVRPHLDVCIQLWGSQHKIDTVPLEQVQRSHKDAQRNEAPLYEERVKDLSSWEKRMLWGTLEHFSVGILGFSQIFRWLYLFVLKRLRVSDCLCV